MKKLLAFMLVLLMLSASAFAESTDLGAMTTEELIALHAQLDELLKERFSCQLDVIYPGNYVVGKDIKEGEYLFSCTEVGSVHFWILTTYATEEDFANRNSLAKQNLQAGKQAQIKLTEGMVLSIGDGLGTIQAIEKPSWAP